MSHSIDIHAAGQSMQAMTEAASGRSVICTFRARYSRIYLYHRGTAARHRRAAGPPVGTSTPVLPAGDVLSLTSSSCALLFTQSIW
jgi:hypothetical protein